MYGKGLQVHGKVNIDEIVMWLRRRVNDYFIDIVLRHSMRNQNPRSKRATRAASHLYH